MVHRTTACCKMGNRICRLAFLLIAFGTLLCEGVASYGEDIVVEDCYVSPLNDVDVPAEAQGVIRVLDVDEGHAVTVGQSLARIDDREAQINKDLANIELEKAEEQAANDVRIRYAREDAKVSAAELDAARTANQRQPGTFGEADLC